MTKVINLFAAPGVGKSKMASAVFDIMKANHINCEIAAEFAKDLVWAERYNCLRCQPYVFGEQYYRIHRLLNKVDYVICESPLLFSIVYDDMFKNFPALALEVFNSTENLNIMLERGNYPYDNRGRYESLEESNKVQEKIRSVLIDNRIPHINITVDNEAPQKIYASAIDKR